MSNFCTTGNLDHFVDSQQTQVIGNAAVNKMYILALIFPRITVESIQHVRQLR